MPERQRRSRLDLGTVAFGVVERGIVFRLISIQDFVVAVIAGLMVDLEAIPGGAGLHSMSRRRWICKLKSWSRFVIVGSQSQSTNCALADLIYEASNNL